MTNCRSTAAARSEGTDWLLKCLLSYTTCLAWRGTVPASNSCTPYIHNQALCRGLPSCGCRKVLPPGCLWVAFPPEVHHLPAAYALLSRGTTGWSKSEMMGVRPPEAITMSSHTAAGALPGMGSRYEGEC
jgi:hypothetical protein